MPKPNVAALRSSQQIIIGLVVCVLLVVALILVGGSVWLRHPQVSQPESITVFDPSTAHQIWRMTVLGQVATITPSSTDADVQRVIDSILPLRVTAEDQDGQLQVVLALNARLRHASGSDQHLTELIQRMSQQL